MAKSKKPTIYEIYRTLKPEMVQAITRLGLRGLEPRLSLAMTDLNREDILVYIVPKGFRSPEGLHEGDLDSDTSAEIKRRLRDISLAVSQVSSQYELTSSEYEDYHYTLRRRGRKR